MGSFTLSSVETEVVYSGGCFNEFNVVDFTFRRQSRGEKQARGRENGFFGSCIEGFEANIFGPLRRERDDAKESSRDGSSCSRTKPRGGPGGPACYQVGLPWAHHRSVPGGSQ